MGVGRATLGVPGGGPNEGGGKGRKEELRQTKSANIPRTNPPESVCFGRRVPPFISIFLSSETILDYRHNGCPVTAPSDPPIPGRTPQTPEIFPRPGLTPRPLVAKIKSPTIETVV